MAANGASLDHKSEDIMNNVGKKGIKKLNH